MGEIVQAIFQSVDQNVGEAAYGKVLNYLRLLSSTGKTDEQLIALGKAYIEEIVNPDPRYSGC
jgi:hypothetical protein